jgi:hypothetical protein
MELLVGQRCRARLEEQWAKRRWEWHDGEGARAPRSSAVVAMAVSPLRLHGKARESEAEEVSEWERASVTWCPLQPASAMSVGPAPVGHDHLKNLAIRLNDDD